ncbi:hypothetical protein V8E54_008119 [Elaphomyces granulatus]|jgi:hypothetical protein
MELSTTANSLPPVPKRGTELAFQLQAFLSGNPNCSFVAEFDGATTLGHPHGDGKASTEGVFFTETMIGTDQKYLVRVRETYRTVIGPFEVLGDLEPSPEIVLAELRKRI